MPSEEHGSSSACRYALAATLTESLCGLPAVATLDWCDRAAACFLPLFSESFSWVILGTVGAAGRVSDIESVGLARRAPVGASSPSSPKLADWSEYHARSVAANVDTMGWDPGELSELAARAAAASQVAGSSWKTGPLGEMCRGLEVTDVLMGVGRIGAAAGRSVIVGVATLAEPVDAGHVHLMQIAVPYLARRAAAAIGKERTRWISPREQEVLDRLVLGRSVREIAFELKRSPHTIHDHVKSLHRKLNAGSRGELISRALGLRGVPTPDAITDPALEPESPASL